MAHWTLLFIVLLSLIHNSQEFAPQGCSYDTGRYTCDFQEWIPPLQDEDFDPGPLYFLKITNVNRTIPAGAFSGLNGPSTKKHAYLYFYCDSGKTNLSRDIFTENLHWLTQLYIFDCYLESGLPSRLLENLKGLIYVMIRGGGIEEPVAHDALAGLTNLLEVTVNAPINNGELPNGFFSGLKNLTAILLTSSALEFIPPNWFDGLVSLERIYLTNNNLQALPLGLFDGVKSLTNVGLSGNPWNCSCELTWLLDWSNITARAHCSEPTIYANVEVEDALHMVDCNPSTSIISSTSVSSTTEILTVVSTFKESASPVVRTSASSSTAPTMTTLTTVLSTISTLRTAAPTVTTLVTVLSTTSTSRIPTASWKASTEEEKEATQFLLSLSSSLSTQTAYAQAVYSSTASGSASPNNSYSNDNSKPGINKIGLITGVAGALTALPVAATVIYRHTCRKKGIKSISDAETHVTDPQNKDESKSS